MSGSTFYHALRIERDKCTGCTHCIRVCPTQALRVHNGKAVLIGNRCVDCGECVPACPVDAITVREDDFNRIFDYKIRIAIIPAVLYGQFSKNHSQQKIVQALKNLGFTHVYEAERSVSLIIKRFREIADNLEQESPLISSFCPAIVRLIQVRFPALIRNILRVKPPVDLTAIMVREQLKKVGWTDKEVGVFYVTPCAAKIAAVKSPVGEKTSYVDGVINMNSLYNRLYPELKSMGEVRQKKNRLLRAEEMTWSLTRGEAVHQAGRVFAIDGIHNCISILEKIEEGKVPNLDFLELRACDEGCSGGVLCVENRFITVERLLRKVKQADESDYLRDNWTELDWMFLNRKSGIGEISPRKAITLDGDMSKALKKLEAIKDLEELLPGVDCGICGAPDCTTFAQDVVQGSSELSRCLFFYDAGEDPDKKVKPIDPLITTWTGSKFKKL